MNHSQEHREVVLESADRQECTEARLVLESIGIPSQIRSHGSWWTVSVQTRDADAARLELDDYRQETLNRTTNMVPVMPTYPGAFWGVLVYCLIVLAVAAATLPWGMNADLFTPGQMRAEQVMSGQWWRTVTALTLHVDEGHVASNLLFGVLFGFLAGRLLGGGVAWFSILIAGAMGNAVNAFVQSPEHTSVGASTAVFGALGILVANALRPRLNKRESLLRRWSPLVGGLTLFALTGVGSERTDVLAHVTGFSAGLAVGWGSSRLPARLLSNLNLQWGLAILSLVIIVGCWWLALQPAV